MDPQINLDGALFHKPCAKCADCNCQITISNFTKGEVDGQLILLCKTHYFKRFKEGGSYVGGEKFQVKASRDLQASSRRGSNTENVSTPASVTVSTTAVDNSAATGSVRERIANIKVTEKPKLNNGSSQPPSHRPSLDGTKSRSSDAHQENSNEHAVELPTPVPSNIVESAAASPEKATATSPSVAAAVEVAPSASVDAPVEKAKEAAIDEPAIPEVVESVPVAAPEEAVVETSVPEPQVDSAVVVEVVVETDASEAAEVVVETTTDETTDQVAPAGIEESPVDDSVIDASPENGVSTPYIPSTEVHTINDDVTDSEPTSNLANESPASSEDGN
jgi:hypothetical protein